LAVSFEVLVFVCLRHTFTLTNSASLNVFLTVHHELTIYWLPTWCTNYNWCIKLV